MIKASIYKSFMDQLIDKLTQDGERLVKRAYETRTFQNQTFNLHDSYGSAVYVNGKLIKSSIRYAGAPQAKSGRVWGEELIEGRFEINAFFDWFKPGTKGIDLVVIAAMPYANILEKGAGLRRKYRVISGARDLMNTVAYSYNGRFSKYVVSRDIDVL